MTNEEIAGRLDALEKRINDVAEMIAKIKSVAVQHG